MSFIPAVFPSRAQREGFHPLRGVAAFLVRLAEARPEARAVARLNAMTDEELAARGLTREDEALRIFGGHCLY